MRRRISLVSVTLFAAALHAQNPLANDPSAATAGARLYSQTCQTCHGGEARGDRGPSLTTRELPHGSSDNDIFRSIREGVSGSEMPAFSELTADQIWRLVSYIDSLKASAVRNEQVPGDPAAGEQLFFGKAACSTCHAVNARGGIVGPDLSAAAMTQAARLRAKILNPNDPPAARVVSLRTSDGRVIRGVRRLEDTYTLHVMDATGQLHLFDKSRVSNVRIEDTSLMPADFGKRLSTEEIRDVVAYLKTLKERDLTKTALADIPGGVSYDRIRNAAGEPQNWLTYWGDFGGRHFSSLKQITPANVPALQARWTVQLNGPSALEATPVVVDGVMYTTGSPGVVAALDARTGLQIWRYQREQKVVNPYQINPFNRGVAVLGNRVFFGTLDAALIALDARTGLPLWETQAADSMKGYSFTSAPLALRDKIVVGVSGGEFGAPGYVDAYDPATGKRIWRFNTVPGPGEYGNDTWFQESWKRGGAPGWLTGSYDPDLDVLYWPIGNPGPDINAAIRKGDNLYSNSVVALDPATGKRKWHYQFTPGDSHDWDATEDLLLVDRPFAGTSRKLMVQANRNGFFYALDRESGKFLLAKPFVKQTWNAGFDEQGRPKFAPGADASPEGAIVYPSGGGGNNFRAPSYDPATGWMYLIYTESGQKYFSEPQEFVEGRQYWSGHNDPIPGATAQSGVMALDVATGEIKWRYPIARATLGGGVLATGGGLVFAASGDGNLIALDSRTGAARWHFQTSGRIGASPMGYSVDGRQFIALSAGSVLYSFALPETTR